MDATGSKADSDPSIRQASNGDITALTARLYQSREELSEKIGQLQKRMDLVDAERREAGWKLKFLATVLSVAFAVAGYLGVHYTYRDLRDSVAQKLSDELRKGIISEDRTFFDNLIAGNALNASQRYGAATSRLMECFVEGHYRDSAVLLPLLDSIYREDDWDQARSVFAIIGKGDPEYRQISDPTVLAYLGAIQVQGSIEHPDWLEAGFSTLKLAHQRTAPGDSATLSVIYMNYWIYYLQKHNLSSAASALKTVKDLGVSVNSWDTVRRWKFFQKYFAVGPNRLLESQLKAMWEQIHTSDNPLH